MDEEINGKYSQQKNWNAKILVMHFSAFDYLEPFCRKMMVEELETKLTIKFLEINILPFRWLYACHNALTINL